MAESSATFDPAVQPEPVSPELVLIDPELARRERARLEEKAYLESVLERAPATPPPLTEPAPLLAVELPAAQSTWRDAATLAKRRVVPVALLCSLLANGFLIGDLVSRKGHEAAQVAVRMVTLTQTGVQAPRAPINKATPAPSTKRAIESKVVALLLSAPASKLPHAFVDASTGLIKNNVHVVCKKRRQRAFLCAIRQPSEAAARPFYVRYRLTKNGNGIFNWSGYRKG